MIVQRWQAPVIPTKKQVIMLYENEGLKPYEDVLASGTVIENVQSPFALVRTVMEGELELNVSGNKLLLRPGDKIILPSNTKHSLKVVAESGCISICARDIS